MVSTSYNHLITIISACLMDPFFLRRPLLDVELTLFEPIEDALVSLNAAATGTWRTGEKWRKMDESH